MLCKLCLHVYYIQKDILTNYLKCTFINLVPWVYIVGWSKTLHQCTIQCRGCSTTQCRCKERTTCSKPSFRPCCERIPTNSDGCCPVHQNTLNAPTYSPDSDSIYIPSNSAPEGEGITWTGGAGCHELPSYIIWRNKKLNEYNYSYYPPKWQMSFMNILPVQGKNSMDNMPTQYRKFYPSLLTLKECVIHVQSSPH